MTFNLIESIQSQVTPSIIDGASRYLGAGPDATRKTFEAAVPAVAGGLVQQGSSQEGAGRLLAMLSKPESSDVNGQGALSEVFGDRLSGVTEGIARYSSMGSGSVSKLLGLVVPLATGALSKQVREQHLDAGGLRGLLGEQRDVVARAIPPGLAGVANPLSGQAGVAASGPQRAQRVRAPKRSAAIPILLALFALLAFWATVRGMRPPHQSTRNASTQSSKVGAAAAQSQGSVAGLEQALSSNVSVPLPQRFQLDDSSASGTAVVANALNRHPSAEVRVEGQRADAVRDALIQRGVKGRQVEAKTLDGQPQGGQSRGTDIVLVSR